VFLWVLAVVCMFERKEEGWEWLLSTVHWLLCSCAIFNQSASHWLVYAYPYFVAVMRHVCVYVRVVWDWVGEGVYVSLSAPCGHFAYVPLRSVCRMCHVHVYFVQSLRIIPA
jgi:hypothetical protein